MISFPCSQCGKTLKVKEELAGKKGKCPLCGQGMRVPSSAEPASLSGGTRRSPAALDQTEARTLLPEEPSPSPGDPAFPTRAPEISGANATFSIPLASGNGLVSPELYDFLAPPQAKEELGRLGPYRILKVLGAGGMGVVFQAEDPQLKRPVALKAMLPTIAASPSARQRFVREAQSAAAIEHDHIVHIYQVGEDRGVPFLAMQFLRGETLDDRLKQEPRLPLPESLRIAREVAEGLAAAHERGLIHRDIKPSNIWLEGQRGRVKILDFGLARSASDSSQLTQAGAIIGTPAYMAPEQANSQAVDARCDLFSLGCVLYRMCTGQMAFKGNDTLSTLMALATEQPQSPRQLDPQIPKDLSGLVMRLLSKKSEDRPPSARAVVQTLEAIEREPTPKEGLQIAPSPRARVVPAAEEEEAEDVTEVDRPLVRPRPRRRRRPPVKPIWQQWPFLAGAAGGVALFLIAGLVLLFEKKRPREPLANNDLSLSTTQGKLRREEPGNPAPWPHEIANVPQENPLAAFPAGSDRAAAEWVFKMGGKVTIRIGEGRAETTLRDIAGPAQLPAAAFRLDGVNLYYRPGVTDDELRHLEGLANLTFLHLGYTPVTDAGLEHLKGLVRLQHLILWSTPVVGTGLVYLKGLGELNELEMSNDLTDEGLACLPPLPRLEKLKIGSSKVTGPGLKNLQQCPSLTFLTLGNDIINQEGLANLKGLVHLQVLQISQNCLKVWPLAQWQAAVPTGCQVRIFD